MCAVKREGKVPKLYSLEAKLKLRTELNLLEILKVNKGYSKAGQEQTIDKLRLRTKANDKDTTKNREN